MWHSFQLFGSVWSSYLLTFQLPLDDVVAWWIAVWAAEISCLMGWFSFSAQLCYTDNSFVVVVLVTVCIIDRCKHFGRKIAEGINIAQRWAKIEHAHWFQDCIWHKKIAVRHINIYTCMYVCICVCLGGGWVCMCV